jgi:hypothetical protein
MEKRHKIKGGKMIILLIAVVVITIVFLIKNSMDNAEGIEDEENHVL